MVKDGREGVTCRIAQLGPSLLVEKEHEFCWFLQSVRSWSSHQESNVPSLDWTLSDIEVKESRVCFTYLRKHSINLIKIRKNRQYCAHNIIEWNGVITFNYFNNSIMGLTSHGQTAYLFFHIAFFSPWQGHEQQNFKCTDIKQYYHCNTATLSAWKQNVKQIQIPQDPA